MNGFLAVKRLLLLINKDFIINSMNGFLAVKQDAVISVSVIIPYYVLSCFNTILIAKKIIPSP